LSGLIAEGVTCEIRVADEQEYAPTLLICLHAADGVSYLARSRLSLAEKGVSRVFVPFPAIDSHSVRNVSFDPAKVTSIGIAWGGYRGRAGEPF